MSAMTNLMLDVCHRLPPELASMALTLRGRYVRGWRYGPDAERLVGEALERESWSPERWRTWQQARLAAVLERAATRVPYYRALWSARRRRGDRRSSQYLEHWPLLDRETVRASWRQFIADDQDPRRMVREKAGMADGPALPLFWGRPSLQRFHAIVEARCRRWSGASRHERWAVLGGQRVTSPSRREPPFWVWNAALTELHMSGDHLTPDLAPRYIDALINFRIKSVWGDPASLSALARSALAAGRRELYLAVAVSSGAPLLDDQRRAIRDAFHGPVREHHGGAGEMGWSASECSAGRLHVWPEVGWTEVPEGLGDAPNRHAADAPLLFTSLINEDMPLVRVQLSARGYRLDPSPRCGCGRSLPLLASSHPAMVKAS